ncbi:hypothetical protein [Acanthopleuribacter pedis]|uniref:Uncharacterized protein n=1 Tax=Acanthopleuribacter pedis TaxID=442870 RepID=A0A8J7U1J4_9BACT|nr:hypothetical protein [Acanthopleuribacter pedis]MBO1318258.1 hypothetical protein [Acanthopleuribacter pedis]
MTFKTIPDSMSADELLQQEGWFLMVDVFRVLDPEDTGKYKLAFKQIKRLISKNQEPFDIMGRRKLGGRVLLLMEKFAPWYRNNPMFKLTKLEASVSFNEFMQLEGEYFFRLSEVCNAYADFLPYSYAILKRDADRREDALAEIGVCKFDTTYIVQMPRFRDWLGGEFHL